MTSKGEEKGENKRKVTVYVMIGTDTNGNLTHKKTDSNGNTIYTGYQHDIFRLFTQQPDIKHKYDFDFVYAKKEGEMSYDAVINNVSDGTFDVVIASMWRNSKREKLVDFSMSSKLDAAAVYYLPTQGNIYTNHGSWKHILKLIAWAVLIGFIMGIIIFIFSPKRKRFHKGVTKKGFFYRSILTTISSMFGEMGYLSENSPNNLRGIIITIIIMTISFVFLSYFQARITTSMLESRINRNLNTFNIQRGTLLGQKGSAVPKYIEDNGGKVEYVEGLNNDQLLQLYFKNKDKYSGAILSYVDGYPYLELYPNLNVSIGFGNVQSHMPVNPKKPYLLEDINRVFAQFKEDRVLHNTCNKYYKDLQDNAPICTLT